jgi:membrane protein
MPQNCWGHGRARSRFKSGMWRRLQPAWEIFKLTSTEWWNDDTFRFAAALAFYTLFSLGPVVLTAVGIASFFFVPALATENIVMHVQELVGWEGARAVRQVIEASSGMGKSAWTIVIGAVTFILGASVVFGELQAALNRIWDVQPVPEEGMIFRLIINRVRSFGIALTVGFLLVISLIASSAIDGLQGYATRLLPGASWVWQYSNDATLFAVVVLLFAMIYKYLPDVRLAWRDVWMGAVVTAVLFTVGKYGIGIYLGQTAIANTFGAAGSLAVLLVWVYYSALISFFGAEFTQVYARQRGKKISPEPHAIRAGNKPDRP